MRPGSTSAGEGSRPDQDSQKNATSYISGTKSTVRLFFCLEFNGICKTDYQENENVDRFVLDGRDSICVMSF